jgi:hypothetical protein
VLGGLAKAVAAIKTGGISLALMPNAITTFFGALKGIKHAETSELKAWMLVSSAMLFAIEKSIIDTTLKQELTPDMLDTFASDLLPSVCRRSASFIF